VGHLAAQGGDVLRFLSDHSGRIAEVHLHDASKGSTPDRLTGRDHLALGQGQVDYQAFLKRLQKVSFNGPLILEVNSRADLEHSVAAVRPLLSADAEPR
jgi:sugar phosphate isomerase/epimerase